MTRILALLFLLVWQSPGLAQSPDTAGTARSLVATYNGWRAAMVGKNHAGWQRWTAPHRQAEIRNRIVSEKKAFPSSIFAVPAPPPPLKGLKMIHVSTRGATAKAAYFGKIDFGVGGEPTDNLMVVSYVNAGGWLYDRADFINLAALPDVRRELAAGDLKYVSETPDFQATGQVPPVPALVPPAKYIAKVYVFCPGREVHVQVNKLSRHRFANAQEAEVVLGGAKDGLNEVTYTAKALPGAIGNEALAVRVYLMSQIPGTQPIKAYEYIAKEGEPVTNFGTGTFQVDAATAAKLVVPGR